MPSLADGIAGIHRLKPLEVRALSAEIPLSSQKCYIMATARKKIPPLGGSRCGIWAQRSPRRSGSKAISA